MAGSQGHRTALVGLCFKAKVPVALMFKALLAIKNGVFRVRAASHSQRKNLPRIQNVLRVQRTLDGTHHVHRARTGFVQQKANLVQAHA